MGWAIGVCLLAACGSEESPRPQPERPATEVAATERTPAEVAPASPAPEATEATTAAQDPAVDTGAPTAAVAVAMPPTEGAPPARFFFYAGDLQAITESSSALHGFGFLVRTNGHEGSAFFGAEPYYERLDELAESGTDDEEDRARITAACASDSFPERLRLGAPVDVLGPDGWVTTNLVECDTYQFGHAYYFAFRLAAVVAGAQLAAVHEEARPRGFYAPVPEELPPLRGPALVRLRSELQRLGFPAEYAALEPRHVGRFALPNGQTMIHIGVPSDLGEDDATRAVCGAYGSCERSALVRYDERGDGTVDVLGTEGDNESGSWQVEGVLRDGRTVGILVRYEDIGHQQFVVARFANGQLHRQTLYSWMGG